MRKHYTLSGLLLCLMTLLTLGASATPDKDYLCLTANTAGSTVELKKNGSPTAVTIEYSTDGGSNWTCVDFSTNTVTDIITLDNVGDKVYFRNASDKVTGFSTMCNSNYYQFSTTGSIAASGNVMSLIDQSCQATTIPEETSYVYCFTRLFENCASLTAAPELPATSLSLGCYYCMFSGCTSLTTAPALPAMTLTVGCYGSMFSGCTSLVTAPELPAMTMLNQSYEGMFSGCTSLTTAPALPATALASSCYRNMFSGCTFLTTAPALPATALASYCYQNMFSNCTSLTTAPALSATTLTNCCYQEMFSGCTSLTTAPALPATTLTTSCYYSMFLGCTSLTTAPELPATTLKSNSYRNMFSGCSKLNLIKVAATNLGTSNSRDWLKDVASNGIVICSESLNTSSRSTHNVPECWSINGYDLTVSSVGWASMYLPIDVTIPEGTEVYYASAVSGDIVTLSPLTDAIPAGTGVIVKAAEGTVFFPYTTTAVSPVTGNLFEGTSYDAACSPRENYVLNASKSTDSSVHFSIYTGTTLSAYKAYLPMSAVGSASSIQFRFDGTTAISTVETESSDDVIYNLAGQRVGSDYHGLVIKNGKKILKR